MTKQKTYVPRETSVYMRYLFHDKGIHGRELLERFPKYSKATVYRHATREILNEDAPFDKRKQNKGRPRKLSVRDERNIIRQLRLCRATGGSFSASRLRTLAGITADVSPWCIGRSLNRQGYQYLHSRKKCLMTRKDLTRRLFRLQNQEAVTK